MNKEDIDNLLYYYGKLSYMYYNTTDYLIRRPYAKAMNDVNDLLGLPLVSTRYIDYPKLLKEIKDENTNI